MILGGDTAVNLSFNYQVFVAGNLSFNFYAWTYHCTNS